MSVNKAIIVGHLGKDPELRFTQSGTAVASFSVATSEKFKSKDGESKEVTEWHNIVVWRQLAEICGKYLSKGSQIYLEGKIQTRKYQDRDGNDRYVTEIVADQMRMLGGGQARENKPANPPKGGGGAQSSFEDPPFNPDDEIPFRALPSWREFVK